MNFTPKKVRKNARKKTEKIKKIKEKIKKLKGSHAPRRHIQHIVHTNTRTPQHIVFSVLIEQNVDLVQLLALTHKTYINAFTRTHIRAQLLKVTQAQKPQNVKYLIFLKVKPRVF